MRTLPPERERLTIAHPVRYRYPNKRPGTVVDSRIVSATLRRMLPFHRSLSPCCRRRFPALSPSLSCRLPFTCSHCRPALYTCSLPSTYAPPEPLCCSAVASCIPIVLSLTRPYPGGCQLSSPEYSRSAPCSALAAIRDTCGLLHLSQLHAYQIPKVHASEIRWKLSRSSVRACQRGKPLSGRIGRRRARYCTRFRGIYSRRVPSTRAAGSVRESRWFKDSLLTLLVQSQW